MENTDKSVGELSHDVASAASIILLEHFDLTEKQKQKLFEDFQNLAIAHINNFALSKSKMGFLYGNQLDEQ